MEQQSIQWRMDKVQELSSQGNSQREIARILQVGIGTINRDLSFLRQQAKENIRKYIDERLSQVSCRMSLFHLPNLLSRYSDTAAFWSSICS
jgi:Trp operon repressor